jgi:Sensors of blue-light using FAD
VYVRNLIHCIYASAATYDLSCAELGKLLAVSRENNKRLGITGLLLYVEGNFFQVLEGERLAVESAFEEIERDPRHTHVTLIISEPISHRVFHDWSMGFSSLSHKKLAQIGGARNFFACRSAVSALQNGRARKLLLAFCEGRWRTGFALMAPRSQVYA